MSNTIHTLLRGDTQHISKPDDISEVVAEKLKGHFGIGDSQSDMTKQDTSNPYDNYQMS